MNYLFGFFAISHTGWSTVDWITLASVSFLQHGQFGTQSFRLGQHKWVRKTMAVSGMGEWLCYFPHSSGYPWCLLYLELLPPDSFIRRARKTRFKLDHLWPINCLSIFFFLSCKFFDRVGFVIKCIFQWVKIHNHN